MIAFRNIYIYLKNRCIQRTKFVTLVHTGSIRTGSLAKVSLFGVAMLSFLSTEGKLTFPTLWKRFRILVVLVSIIVGIHRRHISEIPLSTENLMV